MDDDERIYVEFAPEIKARLNNRVALEDILRAAGIDAAVEWHAVPPIDPEERSRALVETVAAISIAASLAGAIKLLESAITHYLDHKAVRDTRFEYWAPEPLLDGKGKPILDGKGKPRITRRRIGGFDELPVAPGGGVTISVGQRGLSASIADDGPPTRPTGKVPKGR